MKKLGGILAKLVLIGLPIGNKEDLTARAKDALESGKYFLAEDTRSFGPFLKLLGIPTDDKNLISFHDFSTDKKFFQVERLLNSGEDVYLVSEAGSPIISDPAFPLVRHLIQKGYEIDTLPGVTAPIVALELSGLPPHPFQFHGFFPREKRDKFISQLGSGTHIIFESPHRILDALEILSSAFPEGEFCVCRELTKKFQSTYRFRGENFEKEQIRAQGEFVIVLYLKKTKSIGPIKLKKLAQDYMQKGGKKALAKVLAEILGEDAKKIYADMTRNA
ncbi:MAG: 16S rRNA (cytidine(1402)-2'-O)-methyltransferase [Epsilonproteobacteria bacterium]|nr:MAG: 16S rRNA (cytidine(1402)-2'-O)-methyltransferase [Campylobacterota bacterium]